MKKFLIHILIIVSLTATGLHAEDTRYAASFLELGIGARALAMGGAYVGLSDDATGFYWNPGGLALLPNLQAASMYAEIFKDLGKQSYFSAAMPIFGGASISLSWIRVSVEDIPRYEFDDDNGNITAGERIIDPALALTAEPSGYFGNFNDAFIVSFAKYVPWNMDLGWQYFEVPVDLGFGFNMKMLRQTLDDKTGSGVGLDAGVVMRLSLNDIFTEAYYGDLSFGLSIQDLANTQISWNTDSRHKDRIARNFKYGFAYMQPLPFMQSKFTFSFDLNSRYSGSTHLGGELLVKSHFALRMGVNSGFFTTGAGLYFWKLHLDYAYQSHDLGNLHRVSLLFGF